MCPRGSCHGSCNGTQVDLTKGEKLGTYIGTKSNATDSCLLKIKVKMEHAKVRSPNKTIFCMCTYTSQFCRISRSFLNPNLEESMGNGKIEQRSQNDVSLS